jgi:hypothetical protein
MRLNYPSFLVMQYSPRSVALHPGVLSEHEAIQLFTEVLNHIVTFRLAVDEEFKVSSPQVRRETINEHSDYTLREVREAKHFPC